MDSVGEGEGGMIWENSIETWILSYVKQIASPGSMRETGCSGLVRWDDTEGWDGEGDGRGVQDGAWKHVHLWLIHVTVWQKPPQYCEISSLQLKKQKNKKTIVKYYLIPVRMAITRKSVDNKPWWGCGVKGTLFHCWWECKLVPPLWTVVWRFLKNL